MSSRTSYGSENEYSDDDMSSNSHEEEPSPLAKIKGELQDSLHEITSVTSFASHGPCPVDVNPGLSIHQIGAIGLPLSIRDAQLISSVSSQAPYGKGSDTIVDLSVRNTWELDASRFELSNPAWQNTLKAILRNVAVELQVAGGEAAIRANLYKMLLYEPGSMFKEHRDSEKETGMFATLVIVLPSKHQGGDVHVSHGGKHKILQSAERSDFGSTYLCWYADVAHEITPVTSGYRLALTYNLINARPEIPAQLPNGFDAEKEKLEKVLRLWRDTLQDNHAHAPTLLTYILEHLYTYKSLSLSGLKGGDRAAVDCLSQICQRYGFVLYLANVQREISGECGDEDNEADLMELYRSARRGEEPDFHDITKVDEESLDLLHISDLNGQEVLRKAPLRHSQIVQDDAFEGDPTEEDFIGPTGNQGVQASHFYHRSAVLLLSQDYHTDFFFNSLESRRADMTSWLDRSIQSYNRSNSSNDINLHERAETELRRMCQLIVKGTSRQRAKNRGPFGFAQGNDNYFSDRLLGHVIQAGLQLNDQTLCSETLASMKKRLPQPVTMELIQRFGFEQLENELTLVLGRLPHLEEVLQSLIDLHSHSRKLDGQSKKMTKHLSQWMKRQALEQIQRRDLEDIEYGNAAAKATGDKIAEFGIICGDDYLLERMVPALVSTMATQKTRVRHRKHTCSVLLAFLSAVYDSEKISREQSRNIFTTIVASLMTCLTLSTQEHSNMKLSKRTNAECNPSPDDVLGLLDQCHVLELEVETLQIMDKLALMAKEDQHAVVIMRGFFVPLMGKLSKASEEMDTFQTPQMRQRTTALIDQLIHLYVGRCVGARPTAPTDWRRKKCGCGCQICQPLDAFLDSSAKEISTSAGSDSNLVHLQNQLPRLRQGSIMFYESTRFICEHETRADSEFSLWICKTDRAWSFAVDEWEDERGAAQKLFDEAVDDEGWRGMLKKRLDELGPRVPKRVF